MAGLGPTSPHRDPGSGLQISVALSSFPSDLPCPLPDFQEPQFLRIAGAAWGHLLHAVSVSASGRGHRPSHYVMIR